MAYEYYMTRRFSSTSELNNFLNGTELKSGSATYASSGTTLTDSSGGFGTNTYDLKRIVISESGTELTVNDTTSNTVIELSGAASGISNGATVSYKIYSNDEIASGAIVSIQQDHSNLWVLVYKTTTAGF